MKQIKLLKYGLQIILIFTSLTLACNLLIINNVYASPTPVSSPYIPQPRFSIGAPWDRVKVVINATDAEYEIDSVTIFYNISRLNQEKPLKWDSYSSTLMTHWDGNNKTGSWFYEFQPQQNETVIYFYVSVIDSMGHELSPQSKPEEAGQFRIFTPKPSFTILSFRVEKINIKDLTADVSFSVMMKLASDNEQVSLQLKDNHGDQHFLIPRQSRFEYISDMLNARVVLFGDPTAFPFDSYHFDLTFMAWISCEPNVFETDDLILTDYNDRSIWNYNYSINTETNSPFSKINIENIIDRKTQNAYIYFIPTIICFLLLGGSHLLQSEKDNGIMGRLTIYLTIFVFVVGNLSVNQSIQNMIPEVAVGITSAELTLTWFTAYSGLYLICSLGGYFLKDVSFRAIKLSRICDLFAITLSLVIFFTLPVVSIDMPSLPIEKTLYEHIPDLMFKNYIVIGLTYGGLINLLKFIGSNIFRTSDVPEYIS